MLIKNTENIIVSVASKLFSRFGFHKTSMDEIAKIARKAKGSLYYHFSSKEELFKEVVSKEMCNLKAELSIIVKDESLSPTDKIKTYLIKRMEVLNEASNYHETIKADFYEHFDFIDDLRSDLDNWEKSQLKIIILKGVASGEFAANEDVNILLDVLIMVIKGLEVPFFLQNKYETYTPYFESLMQILIKGLAP